MKKGIFFVLVILLFFSSCSLFKSDDYYVETLEFKSGKYTLYVGEAEVCYVNAVPSDSFDFFETEYSLDNSDIVSFEGCTDSYCIIKGVKEGTAILSAELGGKVAKAAITVKDQN